MPDHPLLGLLTGQQDDHNLWRLQFDIYRKHIGKFTIYGIKNPIEKYY